MAGIGSRRRNKGKRGERQACKEFSKYGFTARRTAQSCGKFGTADIEVDELPEFHFECKVGKSPPIQAGMLQAIEDSQKAPGDPKFPVVVSHKDRHDWLITMRFDDFMPLLIQALFRDTVPSSWEIVENGPSSPIDSILEQGDNLTEPEE